MTKIHFRPYNPNQTVLFPQRIDEDIAENDPVRMVDALVEGLNLESFRKLYKECCSFYIDYQVQGYVWSRCNN